MELALRQWRDRMALILSGFTIPRGTTDVKIAREIARIQIVEAYDKYAKYDEDGEIARFVSQFLSDMPK